MSEVSFSLDYLYIISAACDSAIELLLVFRWYHTRQENGKGAIAIATPQDLEHYVHSGLQLGHGVLVVVHGVDGLAVDFGDDVAAAEAEVVRKARGFDIGDQHTALAVHADARGAFRRKAIDAQTEFGWRGFTLLLA